MGSDLRYCDFGTTFLLHEGLCVQTSIHFVLVDGPCRNGGWWCGVGRESQCLTPSFFDSATRRLRTDPETATLVAHTIELYKAA